MRKNPHVRICGGLGSATTLVYPTYRGVNAAATAVPHGHEKRVSRVNVVRIRVIGSS